jgi:hypothetical protein
VFGVCGSGYGLVLLGGSFMPAAFFFVLVLISLFFQNWMIELCFSISVNNRLVFCVN